MAKTKTKTPKTKTPKTKAPAPAPVPAAKMTQAPLPGTAAPKPAGKPGHWSASGTRKYQTNGPAAWTDMLAKISATLPGRPREGTVIGMCLSAGIELLSKKVSK